MTNDERAAPKPNHAPMRGAGVALIGCALASVALLVAHPEGGGSLGFAGMLKAEASQALSDAVVHGGFVLVLAVEMAGFAALAVRVGARRTLVLTAMSFFLVGAGLLSASMIVDGLITPAVAARYASLPSDKQEAARPLFVLIGAALRVLMPMGLAFQGAAALVWGPVLVSCRGSARVGGVIGLVLGVAVSAAIGISIQSVNPIGLMIAIVATAAWALTAGLVLLARPRRTV